jgi:succinate dehydrogenase/fumarate reductase flavoprotein subunit
MISNSREAVINTDILVIGGGLAGFFAAIKAREKGLEVTLADKAYVGRSGGSHFGEGELFHFGLKSKSQFETFMKDFSVKSEYLNNHEWDEICIKESQDRYNDLVSWGAEFVNWTPYMTVEYEIKALAYRQFLPKFREKALGMGIKILDRIMFCDLLKKDGEIVGAIGFHTTTGDLHIFQSKATVICTGGSSLKRGNQPSYYWSSDGPAMAYRAGAEISGQEFIAEMGMADREKYRQQVLKSQGKQVTGKIVDILARYPYARGGSGWSRPTINAEGGAILDPVWEAHMGRAPLYADFDTFTPEQMAGIHNYLDRLGDFRAQKVGLDVSQGGKIQFPGTMTILTSTPGGGTGIWPVDKNCASGLPGLYMAGDCCATMASGAMYIGKGWGHNHAAVTGTRAGLAAAEYSAKSKQTSMDEKELTEIKENTTTPVQRKGGFSPAWVTQVLHGYTVPYFIFGIKKGDRLSAALTFVEFINQQLIPKLMANDAHEWRMAQETKNMALTAEMMLRSSLFRTESRGSHFREDYPRRDDPAWLAWVKIKNEQGKMMIYKQPIPEEWWPDLTKSYEERYPNMRPGE